MQSTTRGFTLIELILYFAIVGIVLFSILEFSLTALQNDEHYAALSNQRQTASRVLNTIDFLVRNADGLVEDTSGNDCFSTTTVLLYFATSSSDFLPPGCMGQYAAGAVGIRAGSASTTEGIMLTCYQDYPSNGKPANCSADIPSDAQFRLNLVDTNFYLVGAEDLRFNTTTLGSRQGIETIVKIGYKGSGLSFKLGTTTVSSTQAFRNNF